MESVNARIKRLINALGISQNAFAKALNTSSSRVSNIITDRNKPDSEMLETILKAFRNVSADWLLLGEGEMFRNIIIAVHPHQNVPLNSTDKSTTNSKSENLEVHTSKNKEPPRIDIAEPNLLIILNEKDRTIKSMEREIKVLHKLVQSLEYKIDFMEGHTAATGSVSTTQNI